MAIGFLLAGATLFPSIMAIGSKVIKHSRKIPYGSNIAQASAFGLGYGGATNIGYNLSNNYLTSSFRPERSYTPKVINLQKNMPYGQRKIRVWSTRYRRYIYVYPRRYSGSNRSRGYSRTYRRY